MGDAQVGLTGVLNATRNDDRIVFSLEARTSTVDAGNAPKFIGTNHDVMGEIFNYDELMMLQTCFV
jgi:hypothetical protein